MYMYVYICQTTYIEPLITTLHPPQQVAQFLTRFRGQIQRLDLEVKRRAPRCEEHCEEHCNTHTYTQFIAHCKLSTTPEGQFGPEGPVGPEEPVGPVGPVGLEVQVGPEGPVEPEGPVGPEDLLHQKASLGQRT